MNKLFVSEKGWKTYSDISSIDFVLIDEKDISGAIIKGNKLILDPDTILNLLKEETGKAKKKPILHILFHNTDVGYAFKYDMPIKKFNKRKLDFLIENASLMIIEIIVGNSVGVANIVVQGPNFTLDTERKFKRLK